MSRTRPRAPWTNWAGDQACTPAEYIAPESVAQVQDAVAAAAADGRTVRVVGAGHSFGDNVLTAGTLMSLDRLTGLLGVDRERGLVRVAAGTRLRELNELLAADGLALPNLGDIDSQSVAGAISTATHGTGRALGNLATLVHDVELVTADGTLVHCATAGPDVLAAARVAVGALGVITAYTLEVVPAFVLKGEQSAASLAQTLAELDDAVEGNDHFEFFTFPYSDDVIAKRTNRVTADPDPDRSRLRAFVEDQLVENGALDLICRLGRAAPRLIPRLNRTTTALVSPSTRVGASHRVLVTPRHVRFTETEWALPRAACAAALTEMRRVVATRRLAVNFPFEVRFVAGDTASHLSPAYDRDSCYIAAHMYQGMEWQPFFTAVQDVALAHGGRPHWGKRHLLGATRLAGLYPRWDDFQRVRRALDPAGVFANEHIRRIFGD